MGNEIELRIGFAENDRSRILDLIRCGPACFGNYHVAYCRATRSKDRQTARTTRNKGAIRGAQTEGIATNRQLDRDTVIEPIARYTQRLRWLWCRGNGYLLASLDALIRLCSQSEPVLLRTVILLGGALKGFLRGDETLLCSFRLCADVECCHRLATITLVVNRIVRRLDLLNHATTLQNLHGARYRLVENLPTRFILVGDGPEVDLGNAWRNNTCLVGKQVDG